MLTSLRKSSSVSSFSIACFRSYIAYRVSFIFHLNAFLVSVFLNDSLICFADRGGIGLLRGDFRFMNFTTFCFLIFIFLENVLYPHPHPRPTTSTHHPPPTTFSYTTYYHTHSHKHSPSRIPPVVGYHPAIRSISSIFHKHIHFLSSSQLCATLFKSIPLVAFLRSNKPEIR